MIMMSGNYLVTNIKEWSTCIWIG